MGDIGFLWGVHGFAGQVLPLLQRLEELDTERTVLTLDRAKRHLLETAIRSDGRANWPAILPGAATGGQQLEAGVDPATVSLLVQYCHGAPGMVISFSAYPPDDDVDRILCEGGELVWQAGPLVEGSNLCHGTGGNGYSFLKLHARTGDEVWLDRARRFAAHGMHQYRAEMAKVGHQRFSLWTGDPGFAIYLAACIDANADFPTIDAF